MNKNENGIVIGMLGWLAFGCLYVCLHLVGSGVTFTDVMNESYHQAVGFVSVLLPPSTGDAVRSAETTRYAKTKMGHLQKALVVTKVSDSRMARDFNLLLESQGEIWLFDHPKAAKKFATEIKKISKEQGIPEEKVRKLVTRSIGARLMMPSTPKKVEDKWSHSAPLFPSSDGPGMHDEPTTPTANEMDPGFTNPVSTSSN